MKRFPLLFSIIGLLSLHLFFPAAFAQEQNSSPLMMLIGAHGEEKNLLSIPTHEKKELQSRNDDENNSSFVKREALSRGGPREIISEENNSSTSPKTSLSLANSMDNISSPLTDPTEIRNQTFSSASQEETKADSPDASFQGIPIAIEQQQLPSFHPDNDMGEGTWHHVPSSLPSDHLDEPALRRFVQSYNRAGQIQKRKKVYEEELKQELIKNLSPQREDRIFVLQKLLPLLDKALLYQNDMVDHLVKSELTDPRKKRSQLPFILESSLKINEPLNKIERIAEQLEQDHLQLMELQMLLEILEQHLATLPPNQVIPPKLEEARKDINEAKVHQRNLIEQKTAYAQALRLPHEQLDPSTQTTIEELASNCRREGNLCTEKQAVALHLLLNSTTVRLEYYHQQAFQASQAAEKEAQKPQPREKAIDFYTQAADRFDQAAVEYAAGHSIKAGCLSSSAKARFKAATETQNLHPREKAIDLYTQAVDRFDQAAALACVRGDLNKAIYLRSLGSLLFKAAIEAQQLQPQEQVISWYNQAADRYRKGEAAERAGNFEKAEYLELSAGALSQAAIEAQRSQPDQMFIKDRVREAEENYEKAINSSSCTIS